MLEHNDFLTSQSQKIREFYKYMAKEFPFLAFTFRGRIKSLIRTEEKFNGYIVEYIYNYYEEHGTYPAVADLKEKLSCFRDIIAYRIVIALPKCHLKPEQNLEEEEMKYLYQIANALPGFLEERGFTAEPAKGVRESKSELVGWRSKAILQRFHIRTRPCTVISLYISHFMIIRPEAIWKCSFEQRKWTTSRKSDRRITWGMRSVRSMNEQEEMQFQKGECIYFDEAYERGMKLFNLDLKDLDVNMFAAMNNSLINDGCGLYRGRLILPYEHLSRFQNDLID